MEEDYVIRGWTIRYSLDLNKKGASSKKIIEDAAALYGYLFPDNGKVEDINKKKKKGKKK